MTDHDHDHDLPNNIEITAPPPRQNVLFPIVMLVTLGLLISMAAWEARQASNATKAAAECIIEQFAEHREDNRSAHLAFADKLGAPYDSPLGHQPPHVVDRLEEACAPFVSGGDEKGDE